MLLTDTYINQSIIVVESERIYMPFIYWNICGRYEELRVISNSNSIRGSLTTKMISAFTSPKADITQISRFSELAWAAIHEIEKNCNEIARLAAIRDTLLPKLMNGEIDVSTAQIQAACRRKFSFIAVFTEILLPMLDNTPAILCCVFILGIGIVIFRKCDLGN